MSIESENQNGEIHEIDPGSTAEQPQTPVSGQPSQPPQGFYHYTGAQGGSASAASAPQQPTDPFVGSGTGQETGNPYSGQTGAWEQNNGYSRNAQYSQPNNGYQAAAGGAAEQPRRGYSYQPGGASGGNGRNKKNRTGLKIAALALACVLVGGGVGGGIAAAALSARQNTVTTAVQTEEEPSGELQQSVKEFGGQEDQTAGDAAAQDAQAQNSGEAFQKTTINITSNSETNSLTPKDVYENYVNAVVAISNEGTTTNYFGQTSTTASSGSGMIISSDGYILTNNHVVADAQTLTVIMTNGEEYEATIIGADSENDVALIKIDATDLPTVAIGNSDNIAVGQQLCAIGNPLGELTNTLTVGYVSALDREIYESNSGTAISMFQTDCAINSGNSGGPIFDMSGNVVGITTAKYSSSGLSSSASIEGIGFCVPINDAMDIVNDFLTYGYVRGRATIGITCQNISSTVTQYYDLPVGVYVVSVTEGTGAEEAGLEKGDIICTMDGQETTSISVLKSLLKSYSPGDSVTLEVYRSGETITMELTLSESVVNSAAAQQEQQTQETQPEEGQNSSGMNPFSGFGFNFGY